MVPSSEAFWVSLSTQILRPAVSQEKTAGSATMTVTISAPPRVLALSVLRAASTEQITHGGGGYVGLESADRKALLYQPALRTSPVMAQPLAGGAPAALIACVIGTAVAVSDSGIYYVPCSSGFTPGQTSVRVMNPGTGEDREVGKLEQYHVGSLRAGFAVSPDGKTIVYSRTVNSGADLMMIDNFR